MDTNTNKMNALEGMTPFWTNVLRVIVRGTLGEVLQIAIDSVICN